MSLSDSRDLELVCSKIRRLLDLDADPTAIDARLGTEPALARLVTARPGSRSPGAVDGFEIAVRAMAIPNRQDAGGPQDLPADYQRLLETVAAADGPVIIVLAVLRHDQRLADMAGGNEVSASTVRRWVLEVIGLLAARAPRLDRALNKIARAGGQVVLMDGTLVRTRRRTGAANRKNYSGKHKVHGLLFLALIDTHGNLLWISAARRGAASEITAARHDHICAKLRAAGLGALADLGFVGLDDEPYDDPVIVTGRKATRTRKITTAQKQANQLLNHERAPVEHGFADLKNWRILTRLRLSPSRATALLRALLVLTNLEITR